MKTVREVLETCREKNTRIWFDLGKEDYGSFYEEIHALGMHYANGKEIRRDDITPVMAVHPDLHAAHVSMMIRCMTECHEAISAQPVIILNYRKMKESGYTEEMLRECTY